MTRPTRLHSRALDFLYRRQDFDKIRTYAHPGGMSFIGCPCVYCGDLATTDDHVYPLAALREIYGVTDLPPEHLLMIVPACRECNALLHDSVFPSMTKRKAYVKKRLRSRHRRLLALPAWHPQELQALGDGLREYVLLGCLQQEHLHRRLSW